LLFPFCIVRGGINDANKLVEWFDSRLEQRLTRQHESWCAVASVGAAADELNRRGVKTASSKQRHAMQFRRVRDRLGLIEPRVVLSSANFFD
jgi:hypothetical protein